MSAEETTTRREAAIVILNYRTHELVVDCLRSLDGQADPDRHEVIVVDNASPDGSADAIESSIAEHGWSAWARIERSPVNGGFAAGNNVGIRASNADAVVLLNSDTIVRPGALATLLDALRERPQVGLLGPRLEWPDGRGQISTFRFRTPLTELISSGRLGFLGRMFPGHVVARELDGPADDLDWVSFACVAIRADVIERIGLLDETYFMYFEDMDFCRHAKGAGFHVGHEPAAAVVHLRGGTSDVKKSTAERRRRPGYYYAARARYFRAWYGLAGFALANVFWTLGWALAAVRRRSRAVCSEWRDIWMRPTSGRPEGVPEAPKPTRRKARVAHG